MSESGARKVYQEELPSEVMSPALEEAPQETPREVVYTEIRPESRFRRGVRKLVSFVFVVGFFAFCLIQVISLRAQSQELAASKAAIERQIAEEKAKSLQNKVDQNYYQSSQYKEEMARNRFRMIFPGEILIQLDN